MAFHGDARHEQAGDCNEKFPPIYKSLMGHPQQKGIIRNLLSVLILSEFFSLVYRNGKDWD